MFIMPTLVNIYSSRKITAIHTYIFIFIYLLMQVDTEICEQTFSWLSRYGRITRYMNKQHHLFIYYT